MASIISYIGSVRSPDEDNPLPSGITCWDGSKTFVENIVKYSLDDQLRVYLDQTLAAAYYNTFYGKRCHDLINEFLDELVLHFECNFLPKAEREFTVAPRSKILEATKNLIYYVKEGTWKADVPVALIKEYMDAKPYDAFPSAWRDGGGKDDYVPFLMWKNRAEQPDFNETTTNTLGLKSFHFCNAHGSSRDGTLRLSLCARSYPIGTSFSTSGTPLDKQPVSIVGFLSHFNLSGISFERLVGAIGSCCLHFDIRRSGLSSSQKLAMCIASNVMGIHSLSGSNYGVASDLDSYKQGLFDVMKTFLEFAHQKYGTEVKDREVLGRLFYCVSETKEQRSSASYIHAQGGSASADDLGSYQKVLGSLEALQFISQSPTLLSAQSQVAEAVVAATEENTDNKEQDAKPSDDKKEGAAKQPESDQPKEEKKEETDDDKSGEDDTKQDETSEDDTSTDDADLGGDDAGAGDIGDDESGASGEETDASSDDMPEEDDSINTSDDNGVRFEIVNPEGETTDSVMFREEVNNFISNILTNPPEDLSPQDTATLTALQRFWLYSLSIETIMGILGSCCKQLPDSLTKLNTQCTE